MIRNITILSEFMSGEAGRKKLDPILTVHLGKLYMVSEA